MLTIVPVQLLCRNRACLPIVGHPPIAAPIAQGYAFPMDLADCHNNLLERLQPRDRAHFKPHLEPMEADAGTILYEPGQSVERVFFPCGPVLLSFIVPLPDGNSVETALVGREGALGGIVSQGQLPAFARALVQYPGTLLQMDTRALHRLKEASPAIDNLFARYADCLLAQIFQSVACSAIHTMDQRAANWLISASDRVGRHAVPVTQQRLADTLGASRSSICTALAHLRQIGAIETGQASIGIRDHRRLKAASCGCASIVHHHFDAVLAGTYPD